MPSILEVSHVDQSFRTGFWMRRVRVLHDVSLQVPECSIFGFLGANGAGKTTLIHLVAGLRKPAAGTVRIRGLDAQSALARAKIGYLPERPYFHEHLTGEGVLRYFGALSGLSRAQIVDRTAKVLSRVGLSHARRTELRNYSKGMLQRIGIAQAILHDPEFLVLDEPMSGLDPLGRKEMRELILQLASDGRTVLFSSHVIPDVEAICDQVAMIQKGRLLGCGPISQFLAGGSTQTEIAFSGVSLEQARKLGEPLGGFTSLREIPDGIRGVVSDESRASAVLKQLLALESKVLWVTPIRPSLESFFESDKGKEAS